MTVVKKSSEYTITKRRDGRYAVVGEDKKPVNGEEKVKILVAEGLVTVAVAAPEPEPEVEETTEAEDSAGDKEAGESEEAAE